MDFAAISVLKSLTSIVEIQHRHFGNNLVDVRENVIEAIFGGDLRYTVAQTYAPENLRIARMETW